MAKIKLTKNELKTQRDALKRFQRFLPTLQLKKQQLQMEVRQAVENQEELHRELERHQKEWEKSLSLLAGNDFQMTEPIVSVRSWKTGTRNIAGVDVPTFENIEFAPPAYDLFETPAWLDDAAAAAKQQIELRLRSRIIDEMTEALQQELRVVSQRVNLFEKVKIPEAKEAIRKINIYIGDQQTNSVGRSKIAKGKCAQRDAQMSSELQA